MKIKISILLTLLFIQSLFLGVVFAQDSSAQQQLFDLSRSESAYYCPEPTQLEKDENTMKWSAGENWKSYDESFAQQIDRFIGAQWIGISVGQVGCIYSGKDQLTFPVILIFNRVTVIPEDEGAWKKDEGGHYNCASHDLKQCPFYPLTQKQESDLYKSISQAKQGTATSQLNF